MPKAKKKDVQEVIRRLQDGSMILEKGIVYYDPVQLTLERADKLNWAVLAATGRRSITINHVPGKYDQAKARKG